MGKSVGEQNDPAHNVMVTREETSRDAANPDQAVIESVFTSLGLMTWESFVKNRLPLLNLPEDITEALRAGKIAYTKAKAIAIVKDELERATLLKETIDEQLSLSQIKEKIKALHPQSDSETTKIPERLKVAYQKVKKTRIWEQPKKRKQLENLLTKLEALINEE